MTFDPRRYLGRRSFTPCDGHHFVPRDDASPSQTLLCSCESHFSKILLHYRFEPFQSRRHWCPVKRIFGPGTDILYGEVTVSGGGDKGMEEE